MVHQTSTVSKGQYWHPSIIVCQLMPTLSTSTVQQATNHGVNTRWKPVKAFWTKTGSTCTRRPSNNWGTTATNLYQTVHPRYVVIKKICITLYSVSFVKFTIQCTYSLNNNFFLDLLERCTKMRTTNANESFNAQIWRRALKHLPDGKDTVETVAMAVLDFNKRSSGFSAVLENLDISPSYYFGLLCTASTRKRRLDAARHSSTSTKKRRLRKKLFKAGVADILHKKECCMSLGGFILEHFYIFGPMTIFRW